MFPLAVMIMLNKQKYSGPFDLEKKTIIFLRESDLDEGIKGAADRKATHTLELFCCISNEEIFWSRFWCEVLIIQYFSLCLREGQLAWPDSR